MYKYICFCEKLENFLTYITKNKIQSIDISHK